MPKQAKSDVNFSLGHPDSHCGPMSRNDKSYCVNFIPKGARIGQCTKVYGDIDPKYWCRLFEEVK